MNTNNKHPHFSRTVLHNGEERVKRIFRDQLAELAGLLEVGISLLVVVAFGYPTHKSHLVAMQDGDVKYYLDDARDYCVPKRPMEEILLKTL